MEKNIALKSYELSQPDQMAKMATVLKGHVVSQKLYTNIQGKNYAHVEGWQFAGGLMGLFPRIVAVENLSTTKEIKWKADVEIVKLADGTVISKGFAICSNLEAKKKTADEYVVLSMAQTRAIGKAYRNIIGWVMKLAGYEGTPSEEMGKVGETPVAPKQEFSPNVEAECQECANPITKAEKEYSIKRFKKQLCRKCQPKSSRK